MSGTWSRKRRTVQAASVPPPSARNASQLAENLPMPPAMQQQQLQLSRSTEKMFEEAELSGVLTLAGRKLKDFPSSLAHKYNISDLVAADLSSNRLSSIPGDVCEWRSLESLRVRQNTLRRVPSDILLLDSLTFLDLSNNLLTDLPNCLFELPLEILLLTGNRLETLPREIRQLSSTLTELDLSYNMLTSIPADIALLKMLRVLVLKKNILDQFPSELCRLSLQTLDLSSNNFSQLPLHIRKMKTLTDLLIHDNPLQSPPASIVSKGREHIFKWMDTAAGGGQLSAVGRSHHSSSTLRALNLGRSVSISCEQRDAARKSSVPAPVERRSRASRFNTVGGSDSGYGSIVDEQRLSNELVPTCLDDINECVPPLSTSPDEGIVTENTENGNAVSSEEVSLKSVASEDSQPVPVTSSISGLDFKEAANSLTDVSNKRTTTVRPAPVKVHSAVPAATRLTEKRKNSGNGNSVRISEEKPASLDLSNNNTPVKQSEVCLVRPTVAPPGIPTPTANKPISKVAPLMNTTRTQQNGTAATPVKNHTGKPASVVSKLSPPSTNSRRSSNSSSSAKSQVAATKTATARKTQIPSGPNGNATKSRPAVSHLVRPSTSTTSIQKIGRTGSKTALAAEPNAASRRAPLSKAQSVETASSSPNGSLETLKRVFHDRIGITLPSNRDAISADLSDGVHLCGLLNALRQRAVPSVNTPGANEPLTPMKAKRNVDSFVSACRRLGVPEASLCSSSDVLGKRNLSSIAKTVLFLNRLAPQGAVASKMSASTTGTDSRIISHV